MTKTLDNNERRSAYRIADMAIIDVVHIDKSIMHGKSADDYFPKSIEYQLMRDLFNIEKESLTYIRSIKERSPDISSYLQLLNKKIETISRAISNKFSTSNIDDKYLDLSQGGIGFSHENELIKDNYYALKIWFDESMIGLSVFVKVIDVNDLKNNKFRISCKFHNLSDNDDLIISRHIMQVQSRIQRLKREESFGN